MEAGQLFPIQGEDRRERESRERQDFPIITTQGRRPQGGTHPGEDPGCSEHRLLSRAHGLLSELWLPQGPLSSRFLFVLTIYKQWTMVTTAGVREAGGRLAFTSCPQQLHAVYGCVLFFPTGFGQRNMRSGFLAVLCDGDYSLQIWWV